MKILVWGINYAPEATGIAPYNVALCEFLRRAGHDVRMLTTFAYYPAWRKAPGDTGKLYRTDLINDVPVHRCWHYVPSRVSSLRRIVHEGTFVLTSFLRALTLPRAEIMVVVSPPLLLGAAAAWLGRIKRTPFVFHVQDLQPDAAVGLGMLKKKRVYPPALPAGSLCLPPCRARVWHQSGDAAGVWLEGRADGKTRVVPQRCPTGR